MATSIAPLWRPSFSDQSMIYVGSVNSSQMDPSAAQPYTMGRDKDGVFNSALMVFDMKSTVLSGDLVTNAVMRFTADDVDTTDLVTDVCVLPTADAGQDRLNRDLGGATALMSGDVAWWQVAFGLADWSGPAPVALVDGPGVFRPSIRIRAQDSGGNELVTWNHGSVPGGENIYRLRRFQSLLDCVSVGELLAVTSGGTLATVSTYIDRDGVGLVGDIWAEVVSGETVIATSDTQTNSSMPDALAQVDFTFTGGDAIALVSGSELVLQIATDFSAQAGKSIGVGFAPIQWVGKVSNNSMASVVSGSAGILSGPRYVVSFDLPHLYLADGATPFNDPFGIVASGVTIPLFAVSGLQYDVDVTAPLQEWIASVEMGKTRSDIVGLQLAIPAAGNPTDATNGRDRVWSDVELVIERRPPQSQVMVPRSF